MNGKPDDDEWYELAGSEYRKASTLKHYSICYQRPDTAKAPKRGKSPLISDTEYIRWDDNLGDTGYVQKNIYHTQSYYPKWETSGTLRFSGTRLPPNAVDVNGHGSYYVLYAFDWGYADNHPNDSTALCSFDIGWAVDAEGRPVHLPGADFIRVYTGVNQTCGWIGETSTEVARAQDLHIAVTPSVIPDPLGTAYQNRTAAYRKPAVPRDAAQNKKPCSINQNKKTTIMRKSTCLIAALLLGTMSQAQQTLQVQGVPRNVYTHIGALRAPSTAGSTVCFDSIQRWVGDGSKRAALVIKWNDGKDGNAKLVWGYRWEEDSQATGEAMVRAVAAADPAFCALIYAGTQYGSTIGGMGYDINGNGISSLLSGNTTCPVKFGVCAASGYNFDDYSSPDSLDHWRSGWSNGFWSYWVAGGEKRSSANRAREPPRASSPTDAWTDGRSPPTCRTPSAPT
jgi:hypothetical protein